MYQAFENVADMVNNSGLLFISIYNDQGSASNVWKKIKAAYSKNNCIVKNALIFFMPYTFMGPNNYKRFY